MYNKNLIYYNGYRREHSTYLNELFDISPNGVDYHNPFNVGFEFKESFMQNKDNIFFKVPQKQTENSDFFIFCVETITYYLVDTKKIIKRFKFDTKEKNANIRINTIKKLSNYFTGDVSRLKEFIDKIEGDS